MKNIIVTSLFVSLLIGIIITLIISYFSASYFSISAATGQSELLHGYDAIRYTIESMGIENYIIGLVAPFFVYTLGLFICGVIVGLICRR